MKLKWLKTDESNVACSEEAGKVVETKFANAEAVNGIKKCLQSGITNLKEYFSLPRESKITAVKETYPQINNSVDDIQTQFETTGKCTSNFDLPNLNGEQFSDYTPAAKGLVLNSENSICKKLADAANDGAGIDWKAIAIGVGVFVVVAGTVAAIAACCCCKKDKENVNKDIEAPVDGNTENREKVSTDEIKKENKGNKLTQVYKNNEAPLDKNVIAMK